MSPEEQPLQLPPPQPASSHANLIITSYVLLGTCFYQYLRRREMSRYFFKIIKIFFERCSHSCSVGEVFSLLSLNVLTHSLVHIHVLPWSKAPAALQPRLHRAQVRKQPQSTSRTPQVFKSPVLTLQQWFNTQNWCERSTKRPPCSLPKSALDLEASQQPSRAGVPGTHSGCSASLQNEGVPCKRHRAGPKEVIWACVKLETATASDAGQATIWFPGLGMLHRLHSWTEDFSDYYAEHHWTFLIIV